VAGGIAIDLWEIILQWRERIAEHFLGEAPHSITAKHYAHENGAEFDKVVLWLGKQLRVK
jgi:hypothetical protein